MRVSVIQTNLYWENAGKNRDMLAKKIATTANSDIVVLPEMFTTGFSMNPEIYAEAPYGETFEWLKHNATANNVAITGSYIINDSGCFYNRMFFVMPNGNLIHYNKRHLFRMANEHEHYTQGEERVIVNYMGWNILLLVCYDLRFPAWSRNINNEYDLLLLCANWPHSRSFAWNTLLAARAIENQCYVAACNRVGHDGKNIFHSGNSAIYSPKGELIVSATPGKNETLTASLSIDDLNKIRLDFPVSMDQDSFEISK